MIKERKVPGGTIIGLLESDLIVEPKKEAEESAAEKPKRTPRKKNTDK